MRRCEEDCLGEGAGAAAEVKDAFRLHARDLGGGGLQHRLVARDETPDGLIVGVDLNTEVAPN